MCARSRIFKGPPLQLAGGTNMLALLVLQLAAVTLGAHDPSQNGRSLPSNVFVVGVEGSEIMCGVEAVVWFAARALVCAPLRSIGQCCARAHWPSREDDFRRPRWPS